MLSRQRLAAWAVVGTGLLLVVGVPMLFEESLTAEFLVGLSVVGGGLAFAGALWDDTICRRRRDERFAEIHYRSGYNALLAVAALLGMAFFTAVNLERAIPPLVAWAVTMAGLGVYFGSVAWYRHSM